MNYIVNSGYTDPKFDLRFYNLIYILYFVFISIISQNPHPPSNFSWQYIIDLNFWNDFVTEYCNLNFWVLKVFIGKDFFIQDWKDWEKNKPFLLSLSSFYSCMLKNWYKVSFGQEWLEKYFGLTMSMSIIHVVQKFPEKSQGW